MNFAFFELLTVWSFFLWLYVQYRHYITDRLFSYKTKVQPHTNDSLANPAIHSLVLCHHIISWFLFRPCGHLPSVLNTKSICATPAVIRYSGALRDTFHIQNSRENLSRWTQVFLPVVEIQTNNKTFHTVVTWPPFIACFIDIIFVNMFLGKCNSTGGERVKGIL